MACNSWWHIKRRSTPCSPDKHAKWSRNSLNAELLVSITQMSLPSVNSLKSILQGPPKTPRTHALCHSHLANSIPSPSHLKWLLLDPYRMLVFSVYCIFWYGTSFPPNNMLTLFKALSLLCTVLPGMRMYSVNVGWVKRLVNNWSASYFCKKYISEKWYVKWISISRMWLSAWFSFREERSLYF